MPNHPTATLTSVWPRSAMAAQAAGSLGLAAAATAGGLLAHGLTGTATTAAMPLGASVLGAATKRPRGRGHHGAAGRRSGLSVAYAVATCGLAVILGAAALRQFPVLLAGCFLLGWGNTAVMITRFVVADHVPAVQRGRAISRSLFVVTAGAVVGPNLLGSTSELALWLGLPEQAGLFVVSFVSFAFALAVIVSFPSPSPFEAYAFGGPGVWRPASTPVPRGGRVHLQAPIRWPLVVLGSANLSMVAVMAVAPVHLAGHQHGLGPIGLTVSLHIAAMYVAAPLFGRWSDRIGARSVAIGGAAVLAAAGALGTAMPGSLMGTNGMLILLGLGWSMQVVAGSAWLTSAVPEWHRPCSEGMAELAMGLSAAIGSIAIATPLLRIGGFGALTAAIGLLNLSLLLMLVSPNERHQDRMTGDVE